MVKNVEKCTQEKGRGKRKKNRPIINWRKKVQKGGKIMKNLLNRKTGKNGEQSRKKATLKNDGTIKKKLIKRQQVIVKLPTKKTDQKQKLDWKIVTIMKIKNLRKKGQKWQHKTEPGRNF